MLAASAFIFWAHANTDEIPVVLGFVLILSAILGLIFPAKPWLTGFLLGIPPFLVELLAHFGAIATPYKPSTGIPWPALLGLIPAFGGALFGSAIRHLNREEKHAG